jgi:hypothetical protein
MKRLNLVLGRSTFNVLLSFSLLLVFHSFVDARPSILVAYDDRRLYKEIAGGLKSEITVMNPEIKEHKISTVAGLYSAVESFAPQIVIILGENAAEMYKSYVLTRGPEKNNLPSIMVIPRYVKKLDSIPNNFGIYYEVPIALCVEKLSALTGKKISRVGIIHREYLSPFIRQNKTACQKIGLTIVNYALPDADPNLTYDINKYLHTLKRADLVDALYIPNDEALLRPSVMQNSWKLTLLKFPMLVVVCNRSYLESSEGMSTLCITPDYRSIGAAVGKKAKQIEGAQWKLTSTGLTQATYYRSLYEGEETRIAFSAPRKKKTSEPSVKTKALPEPGPFAAKAPPPAKPEPQGKKVSETQTMPRAEAETAQKAEPAKPAPAIVHAAAVSPAISKAAANTAAPVVPESKNQAIAQVSPVEVSGIDSGTPEESQPMPQEAEAFPKLDTSCYVSLLNTDSAALTQTRSAPEPIFTMADIQALPNPTNDKNHHGKPWTAIVLVFMGFGVAGAITFFLRKRSRTTPSNKTCVLITKSTNIASHFLSNDQNQTLDSFLGSLGFNVAGAKNMKAVRKLLSRSLPDVICVDWDFRPTIHSYIYKRFASTRTIIVFFNIVDFDKVQRDAHLTNVYYIGKMLLLDELRQIVAPTRAVQPARAPVDNTTKIVRNNLEGDIFEDSLLDFLQLVDIGKRTGCLIVEQDAPLGTIYFENGRIVYAGTLEHQGADAIFTILGMKSGRFKFLINSSSSIRNVDLGIMETIMDWAQMQDEVLQGYR